MTVPRIALNVTEAAQAVGVSPPTVRKWIKTGELKTVPHTRRTLIAVAELERFTAGAAAPTVIPPPVAVGATGPTATKGAAPSP